MSSKLTFLLFQLRFELFTGQMTLLPPSPCLLTSGSQSTKESVATHFKFRQLFARRRVTRPSLKHPADPTPQLVSPCIEQVSPNGLLICLLSVPLCGNYDKKQRCCTMYSASADLFDSPLCLRENVSWRPVLSFPI